MPPPEPVDGSTLGPLHWQCATETSFETYIPVVCGRGKAGSGPGHSSNSLESQRAAGVLTLSSSFVEGKWVLSLLLLLPDHPLHLHLSACYACCAELRVLRMWVTSSATRANPCELPYYYSFYFSFPFRTLPLIHSRVSCGLVCNLHEIIATCTR